MLNENKKLSIQRANKLKEYAIADDLEKAKVEFGTSQKSISNAKINKSKILKVLNGTDEDWNNPEWQMKNRISDLETILKIHKLPEDEYENIRKVNKLYRFGITPYYFSLIDFNDSKCPIKAQCIPQILELEEFGELDPMSESTTNPAGAITRRYPNKLIINVTNRCPSYCRHCQRRRLIGQKDFDTSKEKIDESIQYVRDNKEIREVLITGGDALTIDNNKLEYIFKSLRDIPHVEILRLGTRTIVTLPQRINIELAKLLRQYKIFIATQFNHAKEITPEAIKAIDILTDNGIQIRNQMVLLNGINNNKYVIQKTNEELVKARVIPYYLFHPKKVKGTKHFQVSIDAGLEIMKHLEGHTSGMCKPTYIINASEELGKVPLYPMQNLKKAENGYKITTWENKEILI